MHGPDTPRRRGARLRRAREDDVLHLLRETGRRTPGPDRELTAEEEQRTTAAADEALARILASPREAATSAPSAIAAPLRAPSNTRTRRPWRPAIVAIGGLACSLVIATVLLNRSDQPRDPDRDDVAVVANGVTPPLADFELVAHQGSLVGTSARATLQRLAEVASTGDRVGEGPVQHIRLDGWFLTQDATDSSALVPTITDRYFLPDGQYRTIESRGAPLDHYGRVVDRDRQPATPISVDETVPGPIEGPSFADDLPLDPERLQRRLLPEAAECPVVAECLTSQLINLHYTWVPSPQLTAALWSTLAASPDVSFLGKTTDRLGRQAIGFATPTSDSHRKVVLYAAPDTGAFLGSEEILLEREPDDGLPPAVKTPVVVTFTALDTANRISESELPRQVR